MIEQWRESAFIQTSLGLARGADVRDIERFLAARQPGEPDQINRGIGGTTTCSLTVQKLSKNNACATPPPEVSVFFQGVRA